MALTGVETALMGVYDRLAYQRGAFAYAGTGGVDLWDRIDGAGDETFENRVKGANVTAADAGLADPQLGNLDALAQVFRDLRTYFVTDLGLAGLDAYLTAQRWRVDQRLAVIYREVFSASLSAANVHAKADGGPACPGLLLGALAQGGSLSDGAPVDTTVAGPSAVLARVTAIGETDWTVTVTLKRADDSTEDVQQVVEGSAGGGGVGDTYVLGAQAVAVQAAAGQKVVQVAATAQFAAGQQVLLTEWSGTPPNEVWLAQEIAIVDTISENTSLTMVEDLLHTYSTGAYVYPLWVDVTAASGSGGTAGDALAFYPAPDRRLRL
ncbi:MAG: hypothetical protein AB7Y46_16810 [Armatimonadota bacterium]